MRIQNFRSIQDAEFSPTSICALIGGNNCGKSNVLRAINLLLGDRWPSVRSVEDRDFFGYSESTEMAISLWFDESRQVVDDFGSPTVFSGIQFKVSRYKKKYKDHKKGDLKSDFVCIDDAGNPVTVLRRTHSVGKPHKQPAKVSEEIRTAIPSVMVDVDRNSQQHLSGSQWSILGRMLASVSKDLKEDKGRYEEFRAKFEEARLLLRTDKFQKLHETIVSHLEDHTGISGVDIKLDEVDPINLYKSFSVMFQDPATPYPVDVDRMGSGIQSAMVVSLLQAYRELQKDNAILLFEEPELFLHPHGRRHLYRLLTKLADDGTQVIYSTHSQEFVDLERIECVQLVSKSAEAGTTLRPPVGTPLSEQHHKRLRVIRQFSSPRNEIFFADSVVLVEGATEVGVIAHLACMMPNPLELDRLNCSIIDANGKNNLPMFVRMALALEKRVLVIYDTDSDKTLPNDISTNEKCNTAIVDAIKDKGRTFACDPYIEVLAKVSGKHKADKDDRMREHLLAIESWNDVPSGLKLLMAAVAEVANK